MKQQHAPYIWEKAISEAKNLDYKIFQIHLAQHIIGVIESVMQSISGHFESAIQPLFVFP